MNEKSILSLLIGPGIFSKKELKEVASKTLNPKFLKEFGELNIKLPDDTRENERLADDASDVSLIDMDDEELKQQENSNKMDQKKRIFGSVSNKNVFKKSKIEDDDYEDFDDHPKVPEVKANPYEQLTVSQILTIIGSDKSGDIYRYTDLYLPTTKENQQNVNKFLYKNLLRNPKDALKKGRHDRIIEFERAILRMFGMLYEQKLNIRQESIVQQTPDANVSILKDSIKNPILYSQDPVFSPLNSTEWFESLQNDLVKGIKRSTMEIEKEEDEEKKEKKKVPVENINGWGASHEHQDPAFFGNHDNKLIHMEPSSRRVPNSVSYSHNHEKSKAEKSNYNALANLFESTPTRDQEDKQGSENGEEERSNIHPFDDGSQAGDEGADGFLSTYKRSVNLNMREYLNNNYDQDKRALFSFYTMMKGHDKPDTSLWGETRKEILDDNYQTRANINFNYMILPFNNNNNRSIFKYQADVQDVSEVELGLLHKKRRIDKNTEMRIKIGPSSDSTYFNKNVLEASWNDFFFQPKNQIKREKEYNQLLIDLNDKSVFYDKIHPMILGVQKASKKAKEAQEEEAQDQVNPLFEPQGDEAGEKRIDNLDSQVGTTFRPGFSKDYLTALGGKQAPSETDSRSMSRIDGPRPENKEQKRKMKEIRVNAVRQGLDPDNLTKENARELLGRAGRTESKSESVALPSVLKLVNDLKRKTGSQAVIQHSKVAEEFQFNEFHIKKQDFEYFHRPDMKKLIDQRFQPWRIDLVKQEEEKKEKDFVPEDPFGVKELVHSFEHFKNHRRLSLREGKFALFEYIEENPLILSNVGMASRINRYVYSQRAYSKLKNKQPQKAMVDESEELKDFIQLIKDTLGSNGSISFLEEKQNIPLIGQLTNDKFIGVTVIDNNMYTAPIFIHKAPETDFVLVRYTSSDGSLKCYLRKVEYIYTVGQIEPKVEVFNPSCRGLTSFIRKSIKHVIRKKFNNGEPVLMEEMKQLFPTVNDHNMKNYIQMSGGDPDPEDTKRFTYNKEADHDLMEEDMDRNQGNITPEEVCQYERMHASNVRLKNIGLEDMRSCDKINTIRNRYIKRNNIKIWSEETDLPAKQNLTKMNIIANNVSEELQLTAWNLSQSFLSSKQKQGRLYLTGFGDPTGGHGGYSYVKLPLKTSRYEKEEKKNNAQKLNQVTGTESDLRKLPIKHVDRMILSYGNYKEEHISKLSRWDKIDLLRQIANDQPDNEELAKYARSFRLTTKMQREKYQKDINNLFMNLVTNLSKQGNADIPSDDEGEFECRVETLIDKELEETMKKMPADGVKVEEQVKLEDDDDDGNVFDF